MTTPFEVLFSLKVSGEVRLSGAPHGPIPQVGPDVLRMIANSIEDGATVLTEEDD